MRIAVLAIPVILFAATPAPAQNAADGYHAVYVMAGYFLRAGNVCTVGAKDLIETGFKFVNTSELKTVSRSFPKLTAAWMTEGASHFNDEVMKAGAADACSAANTDSKRAQQAIGRK